MNPRPKESQRKQIKSDTRKKLIQAAAEEIAREGYNSANINLISKAAGFAKGTIYNYFSSKRELMLALIADTAEKHSAWIAEEVLAEEGPEQRMQRFFQAGFTFVRDYYPQSNVMLATVYGPDEEFNNYAFEKYQPLFKMVAQDILAYGIQSGEFRDMDVERTARLLMTFYLGTGSAVDTQGRFWLDPTEIADFVINGLRNTRGP